MADKNADHVSDSQSESKRIKSHEEDVTTHQKWIETQGIPVHSEFSIQNLNEVEVGNWERLGAPGCLYCVGCSG
jgi:hypothetical protein